MNSQVASPRPLILVIDTSISGSRGGAAYSYEAGDVLYFTATSDAAEFLFNNREGSIDELNLPAAQTDGTFPTYVLGTNPAGDPRGPYYWQDAPVATYSPAQIDRLVDDARNDGRQLRLLPATLWDRSIEVSRLVYFYIYPYRTIFSGSRLTLNLSGITSSAQTTENLNKNGQYILPFSVSAADSQTLNRSATRGYIEATITTPDGDEYHTVFTAYTSTQPTAPVKQEIATGQTLPNGTYELHTLASRDVSGRRFFYSHTLPIEVLDVGRASRMYLGEANPASPRDTNDVYVDLALSSDRTLTFARGGLAGWTITIYAVRAA